MTRKGSESLRWFFTILCCFALLTGCGQFGIRAVDKKTGDFPDPGVSKVEAIVNQPMNTRSYSDLVYLRIEGHGHFNVKSYQKLIINSFEQFHFFKAVQTQEPVVGINREPPRIVKDQNKGWQDLVDTTTPEEIHARYGNKKYLIADVDLRQLNSMHPLIKEFTFSIKIINPKSHKVVFYAKDTSRNWLGADLTVIYPVLNVTKTWLHYSGRR